MIDSRFQTLVGTLLLLFSFLQEATSLSTTSSSTPTPQTTDKPKYDKNKIASSVAKAERREKERNSSLNPRTLCERCSRPPILCICESLPDALVSTSTHVLILQHPREFRRKTLSTVPLMPLVLENCTIKRGYNFEPEDLELVQDCIARGKKPLMLFPGKTAISLDGSNNKGDGCGSDGDGDGDVDVDDTFPLPRARKLSVSGKVGKAEN
uniref:tRNA-uridine aminocarboxypropyltransferase n=1 Tax=Chaetoceros debilis TaxID=122233 RepID=A0A6S8UJW5_9STRA